MNTEKLFLTVAVIALCIYCSPSFAEMKPLSEMQLRSFTGEEGICYKRLPDACSTSSGVKNVMDMVTPDHADINYTRDSGFQAARSLKNSIVGVNQVYLNHSVPEVKYIPEPEPMVIEQISTDLQVISIVDTVNIPITTEESIVVSETSNMMETAITPSPTPVWLEIKPQYSPAIIGGSSIEIPSH